MQLQNINLRIWIKAGGREFRINFEKGRKKDYCFVSAWTPIIFVFAQTLEFQEHLINMLKIMIPAVMIKHH